MKKRLVVGIIASGVVGATLWRARQRIGVAISTAWMGRATPAMLAAVQRKRLTALIAYARAHSPYYRALYQRLPPGVSDLRALPVVTKPELMARFDEWVTDPAVTRAEVDAFLADPALIGRDYLGRYALWTTSGTTGKPGIFFQDKRALWIYTVLVGLRAYRWLSPMTLGPLLWKGRIAVIAATGGHYAIADWFTRDQRIIGLRKRIRVISVLTPLGELVRELNGFQPQLLLGYPSVMKLLAVEREAGRLRIAPIFIGMGGEWLEPSGHEQIAQAFQCVVRDTYGASECSYIAFACAHGWLHVNADWALLEPVDAAYQPTPSGQPSYTVLLTNLANRVQPVIRYDLGDSVTVKSEPCPCGFPLPAIRVEGRKGDVLRLVSPSGATVAILPMAVATVIEETRGVRRAQVIQTGHSALTLRLEVDERERVSPPAEVWEEVERRLRNYLAAQGITSATITRAAEAPQQDAASGKFREVWSALPASETAW